MSLLLINNKRPALPSVNRASLSPPVRKVSASVHMDSTETNRSHSICLTFDDGPDPVYTPKILDVLADGNESASISLVKTTPEAFPRAASKTALAKQNADAGDW
jgi:peptidoglycan/xylan/chitin deacetylase (PgdA/CDA1 family)